MSDDSSGDDARIEILEIVGMSGDTGPVRDEAPQEDAPRLPTRLSDAREDGRIAGVRQVLRELLPALDDLEACVRRDADIETTRDGVKLGLRRLLDVFRVFDLERIEGTGMRFDPAVHDAAAVTETDRVPANRILEVLRVGYALRGELVRPALVRVSAPTSGDDFINERFRGGSGDGAGESGA